MILENVPGDARPYLLVEIFDVRIPGLLDSGSNRTIMGSEGWSRIKNSGLKVLPSQSKSVSTASGELCAVEGILNLNIKLGNKAKLIEVLYVPSIKSPIILGLDFWRKMEIVPNLSKGTWMFTSGQDNHEVFGLTSQSVIQSRDNLSPTHRQRLDDLVSKYLALFSRSPGCTDVTEHCIETGDALPVKQRYYPVSPAMQQVINEELDHMLADGIVEPSTSPWSSPILMVKKPNGKHRFCVDFRRLNSVTKKDAYPLPFVNTILDRLRDGHFLSSIDIRAAYWQVKVREKDREKTAFTVPGRGLFQFVRMPFGLHNAPATWQRLIDQVVGVDLEPYCFVYLDDIVICTSDFDQHVEVLEKVFQRLLAAGLVINTEKCEFCRPQLRYLGFVVDELGLRVDPEKVTAILNLQQPRNQKEVRQFLGTCSWYRRFISDFSTRTAPLNKLLRKNQRFEWTDSADQAFMDIKQAIIDAPVLSCPDFEKPFELHTDSSGYGLGCVLMQTIEGNPRVIAYASKTLNKAQRNYSATERECLAVVWGIEKFRPYLEGTHFTVVTDHSSLRWLCNLKDPQGRLARWAVRLQPYDYEILHKKGKDHVLPDALSRSPLPDKTSALMIDNPAEPSNDPWYEAMKLKVQNEPARFPDWKVQGNRLFKHQAAEFDVANGWKLVIPKEKRSSILKECHDDFTSGHQGDARTYHRVNDKYYWPQLRSDVKRYVQKCRICQQAKPAPGKPPGKMGLRHIPSRPWDMISTDLVGPLPRSTRGFRYICMVSDVFTKYVVVKPIRNAKSNTVAELIESEVFLTYGVPSTILCDNGPEYRGAPFRNLADSYGCRIFYNARRHPQANPVERYNRTLIAMLKSYVKDNHKKWDVLLPKLAVALRTSVSESTGFSPASLLFTYGFELNPNRVSFQDEQRRTQQPYSRATMRKESLESLSRLVHSRMADLSQKNKLRYDLRRKELEFSTGDWVWKKNFVQSSQPNDISEKLSKRYVGPYRISRKVSPVTYHLHNEKEEDIGVWHVSDLKPFFADSD